VRARPSDAIRAGGFSVSIPQGVRTIRVLRVYAPGCGASSEGFLADGDFYTKWNGALLGMTWDVKNGCGDWINPSQGSARAMVIALRRLARASGHPELARVPWVFHGISGGANFSIQMAERYPGWMAAAWARGIATGPVTARARSVPIMLSGTEQGENFGTAFWPIRAKGAIWSYELEPGGGRPLGKAKAIAFAFFDSVLQKRLPRAAEVRAGVRLRPMPRKQAWLGNMRTHAIAPAASYRGKRRAASWLPDETVARMWREFTLGAAAPPR
jgi:hypothetical protein